MEKTITDEEQEDAMLR